MSHRDMLFSAPIAGLGDWAFDERITEVLPDMIQRSALGYSNIISMIDVLAEHFAQPGMQVYDLSHSLGAATLSARCSVHRDSCKITTIDNSPTMIGRYRHHVDAYKAPTSVDITEGDTRDIAIESTSMVVLNLTLQFLEPSEHQALLDKIYQGLDPDGTLVLSEKFSFEDAKVGGLLFNVHRDFKYANGYSELEISQERNMLENVILTDSMEAHKAHLYNAGFKHNELQLQYFDFDSLAALKAEDVA